MIITGISDEAGKDIKTQIKAHKELGWNALELRLHNGVNASTTDFTDAMFDEVRAALDEAEMTVTGFSSAIGNWSRSIRGDFSIDVEDLKIAAKRMNILGTKYIRTMTWIPDEDDLAYTRSEGIRRYKELAKIAEDTGILLAHENCTGWGGFSPENMLELKSEVDSPNLVLLYDTGNVVSHGDDPESFFKGIRGHFDYIHIKDAKFGVGEEGHTFTYCGEGDGNIAEILRRVIKEDGYDGVISIEPHVAAIVHEGSGSSKGDEIMFNSYLEYGRKLEKIIASI
ncbi:MAG: sugar phosphate isomerase/epimerase family protein [Clostridia bacterium]|nr:sugar phosphate isomerase/epimerase family protein [Clostridia bacterium]